MSQPTKQKGALSRWAQRKQQNQCKKASQEAPSVIDSRQPHEVETANMESASQQLTDEDMPEIDTLNEDSDFSGFMSSGVSDKLRNLALKKMFHTAPFNLRDGLDEYDDDYTYFEKLGNTITSDMLHRLNRLEQEKDSAAACQPDETTNAQDQEPPSKAAPKSSDESANIIMEPKPDPDDPDPEISQSPNDRGLVEPS